MRSSSSESIVVGYRYLFRFPKIKIGAEKWPLCFNRRHSEICNRKIKSISNFWLRASYETARRSRCPETILNKYYFFEFFVFFPHRFCSIVAKLTGHTLCEISCEILRNYAKIIINFWIMPRTYIFLLLVI